MRHVTSLFVVHNIIIIIVVVVVVIIIIVNVIIIIMKRARTCLVDVLFVPTAEALDPGGRMSQIAQAQ
jgi:hypothetical protein